MRIYLGRKASCAAGAWRRSKTQREVMPGLGLVSRSIANASTPAKEGMLE